MWNVIKTAALRAFSVFTAIGSTQEDRPKSRSLKRSKGRYDTAIDAVSRLPRVILVFLAIGFFVWPVVWASGDFLVWARALREVPDQMWYIIALVVGVIWGVKKMSEDFGWNQNRYDMPQPEDGPRAPYPEDLPIVDADPLPPAPPLDESRE